MDMLKPVKEVIPHREPFLFLDEVLDLTETKIVGKRLVRGDEPQFLGHYPGQPVMPGVLLCEAVLQAGAYLMATKIGYVVGQAGVPVVSRLNNVKFKRMVKPGDVLELTAQHERSMMGAHMMKGSVKVDGKVACTLDFIIMLAEEQPEEK